MWKVIRKCEFGLIGEEEYRSWPGAKEEFRYTIKEKLGAKGIAKFTKQIDKYCKEFYPDGAPENFEQLKTILTKLVTNPEYPENPDELVLDDFEDDNIEFYMDSVSHRFFVYVNNEDVKEKFPSAEINIVSMDDPDEEYYFFITDNRGSFEAKEHYYTNITLCVADEDE